MLPGNPDHDALIIKNICEAALRKDGEAIEAILKKYQSLDFLIDISEQYRYANIPKNRQITHTTPAGLLAMENDQESVNFLMQYGAQKHYIIYSYARKGFIHSVNKLIDLNQSYVLLSIEKMFCVYFAYCGYRDYGFTANEDAFIFLLTFTNDLALTSQLNYNYATEENPNNKIKYDLINKSYRLKLLMIEYHLNYPQVEAWYKFPKLIQWFLDGMQLVVERKLSIDILIKIGVYLTPTLSEIETAQLFHVIFLNTYKMLLVDDLNQYIAPLYDKNRYHKSRAVDFLSHCKSIKNTSDLYLLLKKQNDLFNDNKILSKKSLYNYATSFFYQSGNKHTQAYDSKTPDNYTNLIDKHASRLRNKLGII